MLFVCQRVNLYNSAQSLGIEQSEDFEKVYFVDKEDDIETYTDV
jgi:hypothetical protein